MVEVSWKRLAMVWCHMEYRKYCGVTGSEIGLVTVLVVVVVVCWWLIVGVVVVVVLFL